MKVLNVFENRDAEFLNSGRIVKPRALIGVLGAKGGVGATTISVSLAAAFAVHAYGQTALFDANLQQPDAACLLNCLPTYSLLDLAKYSELDSEVVEACAHPVIVGNNKSNTKLFNLYSPPLEASLSLQFDQAELPRMLSVIKNQHNRVVVDLPRTINRELVSMLDLCDSVVLVVEPTVTALAAATRWLEIFKDLELEQQKIITV